VVGSGEQNLPFSGAHGQGSDLPTESGFGQHTGTKPGIGSDQSFDHVIDTLGCDGDSGIDDCHKKSPPTMLCVGGDFV
jgi:hypothetical protein